MLIVVDVLIVVVRWPENAADSAHNAVGCEAAGHGHYFG